MQQIFTQDDVLLYIYNELEPESVQGLLKAMETNQELASFYNESMKTVDALNQIKMDPTPSVVTILTEESRSSSLEIH